MSRVKSGVVVYRLFGANMGGTLGGQIPSEVL